MAHDFNRRISISTILTTVPLTSIKNPFSRYCVNRSTRSRLNLSNRHFVEKHVLRRNRVSCWNWIISEHISWFSTTALRTYSLREMTIKRTKLFVSVIFWESHALLQTHHLYIAMLQTNVLYANDCFWLALTVLSIIS